jgi:hypothetical protein
MLDDELAAAGEQIRQGLPAIWAVELVGLVDLYPRQLARLAAHGVLGLEQRLLLVQERAAGGDPLVSGSDLVGLHDPLLSGSFGTVENGIEDRRRHAERRALVVGRA